MYSANSNLYETYIYQDGSSIGKWIGLTPGPKSDITTLNYGTTKKEETFKWYPKANIGIACAIICFLIVIGVILAIIFMGRYYCCD